MRADLDPEFEAQVTRSLHQLHADPRTEPWPSPLARVKGAVHHQNRVRISAGAAGLAVAVAAAVLVVEVATSAGPQTVVPGASAPPRAAATTASGLSFLPVQTAAPANPPGVRPGATTQPAPTSAAVGPPPDKTPISGAALTRLRAIAAEVERVWGDLAPTRIEVVYAKDGRALSGTAGDPNAAKTPAYALELQGHFTCRSCQPFRTVTTGVISQTYSAKFQLMSEGLGGNTWGDLNRFGVAVSIPPVDGTATPRPLGPTLAPSLVGKAPANVATAEQVTLQQAVDPTTAKVAWSEEITYAQLRQQSPKQFVQQLRKPGPGDKETAQQFAAAADNAKVIVVAIDGLILNERANSATWASIYWVTGPQAGSSTECGPDLCGLKPPTG